MMEKDKQPASPHIGIADKIVKLYEEIEKQQDQIKELHEKVDELSKKTTPKENGQRPSPPENAKMRTDIQLIQKTVITQTSQLDEIKQKIDLLSSRMNQIENNQLKIAELSNSIFNVL